MSSLISRAELARRRGVSRAAVTQACARQLAPACVGRRIDADHPAVQTYLGGKPVAVTATARSPKKPASAPRRPAATDPDPQPPPAKAKRPPKKPGAKKPKASPKPPRATTAKSPQPTKPTATKPSPSPSGGRRVSTEGGAPELVVEPPDDIDDVSEWTVREVVEQFGTTQSFRDWLVALKTIEAIREKHLRNEETEGRLISRELVSTSVMAAIDATNRRLLTDFPKTVSRRLYQMAASGIPLEEAEKTVRDLASQQLKEVKTKAAKVLRDA